MGRAMGRAMEFEQNHDLFILLGFDVLYSINLNQLTPKKSKKSNKEAKLSTVFCHSSHMQPDGSDYPLNMGLFAHGSKLHFFGGENLENCRRRVRDRINLNDIGLLDKHPIDCMSSNWLNNKVFSFNPILYKHNSHQPTLVPHTIRRPILNKQLLITEDNSSTPLPNHFGYKVRPIVATISNKVYALATKPYSAPLIAAVEKGLEVGPDGKVSLFEVFEPNNGNGEGEGEWRVLDNPPYPIYEAILGENYENLTHCVIKDKLYLQTYYGQYIFDTIREKWESTGVPYPPIDEITKDSESGRLSLPEIRPQINARTGETCPVILASLEYKGHLLVFFKWVYSHELVAYDLSSFGNFGEFGDSWEFGDEAYQSILSIDDIDEENKYSSCNVQTASFSLVENNCICLVFNRMLKLNVLLLEVNTKETKAVEVNTKAITATVTAHQKFKLPSDLICDTDVLSTFIFSHDPRETNVGKSNQGCNGQEMPFQFAGKEVYIEKMDKKRPFSLMEQEEDMEEGEQKECKRGNVEVVGMPSF